MEPRRFTLTVSDSEGHPRRGEVVLTQRWQPQWGSGGPETGCAFLIVLLREPGPSLPQVSSPGVAVCLPERPLAAPSALLIVFLSVPALRLLVAKDWRGRHQGVVT